MFGRRCSLCNGKLDGRNICKECGLDNSKSEKYYKINQSSCDGQPLTHVHEDVRYTKQDKKRKDNKKQESKKQKEPVKKSTPSKKVGKIIGILVIVLGLVPSLLSLFEVLSDTSNESVEIAYDPYENLNWGHPEEGEFVSYTLTSGEYIVGVHIAEGDYEAIVNDDFDAVQVTDTRNGLYLYEYQAKEDNYLNDLRLFYGARVTICTKTEIVLDSYNGQPENMTPVIENPIKDSYILKNGYEAEAGTDLPAGVYDLYTNADYAYFTLTIVEDDGTEWDQFGYWEVGKDSENGEAFRNLVLPEGAKIFCEEADMELIPSEWIGDIEYTNYYW